MLVWFSKQDICKGVYLLFQLTVWIPAPAWISNLATSRSHTFSFNTGGQHSWKPPQTYAGFDRSPILLRHPRKKKGPHAEEVPLSSLNDDDGGGDNDVGSVDLLPDSSLWFV